MHIPDGFLSNETWIAAWAVSAGGLGVSLRQAGRAMRDRTVPLMGVLAAFIFAAQMLNFPIPGGTSGHLFGGVLAAVLIGPFPAIVVMSAVLIFQCLILQDGGITALGANIINMSLIGIGAGYSAYRAAALVPVSRYRAILGTALGSWVSVVASAFACSLELWISGLGAFEVIVPAMLSVHAMIGVGEALVSCCIIAAVLKTRPDLVLENQARREVAAGGLGNA